MRARVGCFIALAFVALAPLHAMAADSAPRTWITPFGGYTVFNDNFGRYTTTENDLTTKNGVYGGLRLGHVMGNGIGLELAGGYSPAKIDSAGTESDLTLMHASASLIYSPAPGKWGAPWVSAGGGALRTTIKDSKIFTTGEDHLDQGVFDVAGGWVFRLGDHLGLRLEARNLLWVPHKRPETAKLNYQVYGAGLQFAFGGKAKDDDADGVPNSKDKCPGTPTGATVDATGCPKDSDGDGVWDGLDKCAGTPKGATVDANGCPKDSDGDGVWDGLDKCADTPKGATVDASGCPADADGDGVLDGLDQCPDTPKGATVDAKGCPMDSDGDGVPDGLDKCPGTAPGLKVDKDGCPIEVTEKETELLDTGMIRLQNINFETGKADLLPESYPTLDVVGTVLAKWPELKIEIGGHTDSRGTVALNQKLSEARAQSVLNYVMQKFPSLKADQFTVKGYGKSKPLVPNTNALNMAKNRRVEFVVMNKDVLKKEVEKRKLLQK